MLCQQIQDAVGNALIPINWDDHRFHSSPARIFVEIPGQDQLAVKTLGSTKPIFIKIRQQHVIRDCLANFAPQIRFFGSNEGCRKLLHVQKCLMDNMISRGKKLDISKAQY